MAIHSSSLSKMLFSLVFLSLCNIFSADTAPKLIQIEATVLDKLQLKPEDLSKSISYVDFELYSGYQCAIECLKEKSICTGYSYEASTKRCSLYDDLTQVVDPEVASLVRLHLEDHQIFRQEIKASVCENVKCKPGAMCIDHTEDGKEIGKCVCLNGQNTTEDCDKIEVGIWGDFSDWSTCSVTCGEGYKSRKRECFSSSDVKKQISTDHCVGKDVEIQPCDITTCPVYGLWGSWSPCSTFCGIGVKQRNRSCIPPGSNCGNYTKEQRACGEANCQRVVGIKQTEPEKFPLKGYLSIREGDILCVPPNSTEMAKHMANLVCKSIGLNRGAQYTILTAIGKNTTCYPGIICDGSEKDFYECKYDRAQTAQNITNSYAIITRCIIDGDFSQWSEWSPCSKTCGTGETVRSRTCTEPAPSLLEPGITADDPLLIGKNCTGDYTQKKTCSLKSC